MKIFKDKNAITLLALVITIIIMLLLAGVAIQMAIGENGLIAKSTQAKKQQSKADLYSTAKLEYLNLKTKAIENNQPEPAVESVLSESNFLNKYNIVGDNITNKNNEFIETKENLLKELTTLISNSDTPIIADEDKDKLILRLNVKNTTNLEIIQFDAPAPAKVEFHDGTIENTQYLGCFAPSITKTYSSGTYLLKLSEFNKVDSPRPLTNSAFTIRIDPAKASIDVINWGKNPKHNINISLKAVNKIYSSEPDLLTITYDSAIFNEIPKNLFDKKTTNTIIISFYQCNNINEIPEDLFKNCINVENFFSTFYNCPNIKSIPENLFKYNTKAKQFIATFWWYKGENIPENLFKYNVNAQNFNSTFYMSNIKSIPDNLFSNNPHINNMYITFGSCSELLHIPQTIIDKALSAVDHTYTFQGCTSASNYSTLPGTLK